MSSILEEFSPEIAQLIIMSILQEGGRELQDIRAKLWELSEGNFHVEHEKLRPFLYLMEQKGWIESWWDQSPARIGDRTKRYKLTSEGQHRLKNKMASWKQLAKMMSKLNPEPDVVSSN